MLEEGVGRRSSMHLQGQKKLPQSILQIFRALLLGLRLGARSWQFEDRRHYSVMPHAWALAQVEILALLLICYMSLRGLLKPTKTWFPCL